jgi:phytoene desaturase
MLYLGVEGRYDQLDHHTIFLARDYKRNIREIEQGLCTPGEPSIYVQNPSRTDPAFGRNGGSSLYILVPVGHCGAIDWPKERSRFRDLVIARLESLGVANLSERIRYEKIVTPEDWSADMGLPRGATFNLSHSLDQLLYFRPHNRFEDVDGVYLVGGGTHPGSGLPVIYEGARITADLILRDLGVAVSAAVPA